MARRHSVAIAGYFPTPENLIPRMAHLFEKVKGVNESIAVLDPCAGEGQAIAELADLITTQRSATVFSIEMEKTRFKKLNDRFYSHCLNGDAFSASWASDSNGVSLLYLNPPYDIEPRFKRLEHRFLVRFTEALRINGALLFVVPYYALSASAEFLATHYTDVRCFKFPDEQYKVFHQVVLVASKVEERSSPDTRIVKSVEQFVANPEGLPELPNITSKPLYKLPVGSTWETALFRFELQKLDFKQLKSEIKPWVYTGKGGSQFSVTSVLPDAPIQELLLRHYPVATPPRPSHIAAGIAAGVFNGCRVESNTGELPPILLKGVFVKDYHTVEVKETKKGGEILTQVQQPKLIVSALNLNTGAYRTLPADGDKVVDTFETLNIPSLLNYYSIGLMRAMETQCPIMYDPRYDRDKIALAQVARAPYPAQADAARALCMLIAKHNKAILLGEIGCGKTSVSLLVAKTRGAKRVLAVCPPHLLGDWTNESALTWPSAKVVVLSTIEDVEAASEDDSPEMIMLLTRESAKLSHGWESVGETCPKCGGDNPKEDHSKKHSTCKHKILSGPGIELVKELAGSLVRYDNQDPDLSLFASRILKKAKPKSKSDFYGVPSYFVRNLYSTLKSKANDKRTHEVLFWAFAACDDLELLKEIIAEQRDPYTHGPNELAKVLKFFLPMDQIGETGYYQLDRDLNTMRYEGECSMHHLGVQLAYKHGILYVDKNPRTSFEAAFKLFSLMRDQLGLKKAKVCGEFLYQATPTPRRYALSKYLYRKHRNLWDFMVLDEAQEYSSSSSGQSRSCLRLASSHQPTIAMSGSIMNGYAEAMFPLMWGISDKFKAEFDRSEKQRFIDRYGYRKRIVFSDDFQYTVTDHGSNSERLTVNEKVVGNAPGILPLFLLQHLLPISVTLHKDDLALALPPCEQQKIEIEPTPEQLSSYKKMLEALIQQIKKDRYDEEKAGKLFGMLADFVGYMDRCTLDTGNKGNTDSYEVRYPESIGSELVTSAPLFSSDQLMPKEQWMVDELRKRLADGENVMVLGWHLNLLPRLQRIVQQELGVKAVILHAAKVPTHKRRDWINDNIVTPKIRVMISNPICIQTGLNNLVHFSTQLWMQNPAANVVTYRQAIGRSDRIGKKRVTSILMPVYKGTIQETLHSLLLKKVAVSTSTDGQDPESALLAAGIGAETFLTGLSLGKQLWEMFKD